MNQLPNGCSVSKSRFRVVLTVHEYSTYKVFQAIGIIDRCYEEILQKKRKDIESFKPQELVMLNGKNIKAKHRYKKLEDMMYGPFEVLSTGKNNNYCKVKLPDSWKIHPTFNIALLEQYRGTDLKKQVVEIEAADAGWKTESIIASGPLDEDAKTHVYSAK